MEFKRNKETGILEAWEKEEKKGEVITMGDMIMKGSKNMQQIPKVWAHRGSNVKAPENTLLAFEEAIKDEADGIELDVQLTSDDVLVICHDEKIDRTSTGKGWLKDYTFSELRDMNFNVQYPDLGEQKIPTLEEVFQLIKPTNLTIDIELKTSVIYYDHLEEKVMDLVKKYDLEDRVNYSSFNHYTCVHLLELDPSAEVGFLYWDSPIDFPDYALKHGAKAINPAYFNLFLPDAVKKAKEYGLRIYVWDVETEEQVQHCLNIEADAIIANDPAMVRRVIHESKSLHSNLNTT